MFGIMRFKKYARPAVYGIEKERCREAQTQTHFAYSDIDKARTQFNIVMENPNGEKLGERNFNARINSLLEKYGCKSRKDSIIMVGAVYSASQEFFDKNPAYIEKDDNAEIDDRTNEQKQKWLVNDKLLDYFNDCLQNYVNIMCGGNWDLVLHARIDLDEKTPHLQIYSVPIVETDKGYKLCAKELFGNRADLRQKQDIFHKEVGEVRGLSRGDKVDWDMEPAERKKHKETIKYKQEQRKALENDIKAYGDRLEGLTQEIGSISVKLARISDKEKEAKEKYTTAIDGYKTAYNNAKMQYNELVDKGNKLVKKYNADRLAYNKQVDDWERLKAEVDDLQKSKDDLQRKIDNLEQVPAIEAQKNKNKVNALDRICLGVNDYGERYYLGEFIDEARKHSENMEEFLHKLENVFFRLNKEPIAELFNFVRDRNQEHEIGVHFKR